MPMHWFIIRRAEDVDAEQIAAAHVDSIHSLGGKFYDAEVIGDWGAPRDGQRYQQAMQQGQVFFVAVARDRVIGFSSYRVEGGKHRTAVYVRGDSARHGVGTALFNAVEGAAREHGAREIHVAASLVAVDFYRKCGFVDLKRGWHTLASGVTMECVFMLKTLVRLSP